MIALESHLSKVESTGLFFRLVLGSECLKTVSRSYLGVAS
jgi:hypothetical protein